MDTADFEEYLKERYRNQISWYDSKAMHNHASYVRLQWGTIILSSITPVLIAISFGASDCPLAKWIPVTTAVLVAIFASAQKAFKFEEHWMNYRTTCETLRKEIHLYKAHLGEYSDAKDREALFVQRVEGLISRENTLWLVTSQRAEKKA